MNSGQWIKLLVLLVKLAASIFLFVLGGRMKRRAPWIALAASLVSMGLFIAYLPILESGANTPLDLNYLPGMGIRLSLDIDWLSFPFLLTEEFVTIFAVIYALGYIPSDRRVHLFYASLLLFSAGMSGTTLANDVFLFYFFWELMLIASAFLIVHWGTGQKRNAVALKYFIITHLGSLFVLIAFVMLYSRTGLDHFSSLTTAFQMDAASIPLIGSLFLIGFGIKMAVVPFHIWLPDTHSEAPMPVTIMLAAAMLSMGTYGILRFPMGFLTLDQFALFSLPMMVVGVVSEIYGAVMALVENDIKRIIAYSSVSQMGYILFGLGTLTYSGIMGATLHVIYHAVVKALLFCCVGWIMLAFSRRDINTLTGLGKRTPLLTASAVVGALAMTGVPALAIFNSEWLIFSSGFQTPYTGLAILEILASILTAAYLLRFIGRIFFMPENGNHVELGNVPLSVKIATISLVILTLIAGLFPSPLFDRVANEIPLILGGVW
jgi:NADH-quinone oxidoreductase subunit M